MDGAFDFRAHLQRQREFSERTFGPGARTAGVVDHIRKELREIEAEPGDLREWIDVVILALDGAWRAGFDPDEIIDTLVTKQARNEARQWPDWRTSPPNKAIEHVKAATLPVDRSALCTTNGKPVAEVRAGQTNETGQHDGYIVLCDSERAKGFVRPYRDRYQHTTCGGVTTMGRALSETYARDPNFYSHTFCVNCNRHLPVAEFKWSSDGAVVGS